MGGNVLVDIDQEDNGQVDSVLVDNVRVGIVLAGNVLVESHPEKASFHWGNESLEAHDGGAEDNESVGGVDAGNCSPDVDSSGHADNGGHK